MIQLFQNSTIHGVGHIVNTSNKIWRFFWYLLLFCGIIGIFVNIVFVFIKYFSHPTISSYTLEYEAFKWPEITICNTRDPFMFKKISPELKYWKTFISSSEKLLKSESKKSLFNNDEIKSFALQSVDMGKLLANFSLQHSLILRYHLVERRSDIFKDSTKLYEYNKNIWSSQIVQIGYNAPCFTLHLYEEEFLNPNTTDMIYLDIKLNDRSKEIFNSTSITRSVHVYITNHNHIPRQKNEFVLYPGTKTTLSLSQTRHQYNKNCRQNSFTVKLYDALLQGTRLMEGGYEDCREVYRQNFTVENCSCYNQFLPIFKNDSGFPRVCSNRTIFSRREVLVNNKCGRRKKISTYYVRNLPPLLRYCRQYKAKKCDSLSYRVNQRTAIDIDKWSMTLRDELKTEIEEKIKKYMNISGDRRDRNSSSGSEYKSNNYIHLILTRESISGDLYKEENEYSFSQLLSDVGGLMGLWLGMSVVGLFEIAEMIYRYAVNAIRRKNNDPDNL